MNQDNQVTEEERKLMAQYSITHENKSVYFFKGYKYDRLSDAITYAKKSSSGEPAAESAPILNREKE